MRTVHRSKGSPATAQLMSRPSAYRYSLAPVPFRVFGKSTNYLLELADRRLQHRDTPERGASIGQDLDILQNKHCVGLPALEPIAPSPADHETRASDKD